MKTNNLILGIPYSNCPFKSEIPCTSEEEAVAIAVGATMAGRECFIFMNDMGYCKALNALISLSQTYNISIPMRVEEKEEVLHHYLSTRVCKVLKQSVKSCQQSLMR